MLEGATWYVFLRPLSFLPDGDLYAGTSVDFMGTNAAIFRTSVQGNNQHYLRTEAYQDHWLNGEAHRKRSYMSSLQHSQYLDVKMKTIGGKQK